MSEDPNSSCEPRALSRKKGATLGQICSCINFFLPDQAFHQSRSCSLIPITASCPLLLPPSLSPLGLPPTPNKENVLTGGRSCSHPWSRTDLAYYPREDPQIFFQKHSLYILIFWNNTYGQSLYPLFCLRAPENSIKPFLVQLKLILFRTGIFTVYNNDNFECFPAILYVTLPYTKIILSFYLDHSLALFGFFCMSAPLLTSHHFSYCLLYMQELSIFL